MTFAYTENLFTYAIEKNLLLLSLTVICNKTFLFRRNIFYFPRFLFQLRFKERIRQFSNAWFTVLSVLENIVQKQIPIKISLNSTERFINDYTRDYYCIKYFLERFRENIIALIQDFDYTSNRNIYCELFKSNQIPTVSLNHSILIYKHIFESVYSDYSLVWGRHQKERIEKISAIKPIRNSVIGSPINFARRN